MSLTETILEEWGPFSLGVVVGDTVATLYYAMKERETDVSMALVGPTFAMGGASVMKVPSWDRNQRLSFGVGFAVGALITVALEAWKRSREEKATAHSPPKRRSLFT